MARRGRPRKPTHLKLLEGTYRPDRAVKNEPRPPVEAPSCPTWLHREAKREWRRVMPQLLAAGLITHLDRAALAAYCQCYAYWWEADRAIKRHGTTQVTDKGYIAPRPEVAMRKSALAEMRRFGAEFGLSPGTRSGVSAAAPHRHDGEDGAASFLFGRRGRKPVNKER